MEIRSTKSREAMTVSDIQANSQLGLKPYTPEFIREFYIRSIAGVEIDSNLLTRVQNLADCAMVTAPEYIGIKYNLNPRYTKLDSEKEQDRIAMGYKPDTPQVVFDYVIGELSGTTDERLKVAIQILAGGTVKIEDFINSFRLEAE